MANSSILTALEDGYRFAFQAMASPCEVRIDTPEADLALRLGLVVETEARRIEQSFSRYSDDNVVARINRANGEPVCVDDETAALIDYAEQINRVSEGRFDITSGVLRRLWRFDGSDRVPAKAAVRALLPLIGWNKVVWRRPALTLRPGMEIDFGGVAKEYAVDRCLEKIKAFASVPALVNFGGDLRVSGLRANGARWRVAIESVDRAGASEGVIELAEGALTTSGDSRRFLMKDGVRYSHILDPRTGWPVKEPPRSVTVAAPTCVEAGLLSTLAMMHGRRAEAFLEREGVKAWCVR
jgi:thiamine biosynthesis lipoprotein